MYKVLAEDIIHYIELLKSSYHLEVTIHDLVSVLPQYYRKILPYNIHKNPYCAYLKTNSEIWRNCISRQHKVLNQAKEKEFFGICYCGVAEFVFPLLSVENEAIGFISITGYRVEREQSLQRVEAVAEKYCINKEQLIKIYDDSLSDKIPSKEWIRTLITPLISMYALFHFQCRPLSVCDTSCEDSNKLYSQIIRYINVNYTARITLNHLSQVFHCSKSHISHLFCQKNSCSFNKYLTDLRIKAAKSLLANTELSIKEIAFTVGFSDANYFSSVFFIFP